MKRRDFLKKSAILAAAAGVGRVPAKAEILGAAENQDFEGKLIVSEPMLQNYAETSVAVVFAVSSLANGFVEVGKAPDLSDAKRVMCGGFRTTDIDESVMRIRLTSLEPSTRYYYRIGAHKIKYKDGYNMSVEGTEIRDRIYSFTTAGKDSTAHFCVINDTHSRWESFGPITDKLAALSPSCVIWNGDATNREETIDKQIRIFLNPKIDRKDYASCTPYLLCPGNHDQRGRANRNLEKIWLFRQNEERSSRDWDLGRNFAVRMGDIAMIGLDTGEDKLDTNPRFAGLFNNGAYREAQRLWLEDALKREEISSAPFLVAFCHIPLFDDNPNANPGDVYPDDHDIRYKHGYAAWQRTCFNLWGPLLNEAGCQLVITGHQHIYRYLPSGDGRHWGEIIGGGPDMGYTEKDGVRKEKPESFPTVVDGQIRKGKLEINVYNIVTGKVQETLEFKPRKI